jgi:hypothetical protein
MRRKRKLEAARYTPAEVAEIEARAAAYVPFDSAHLPSPSLTPGSTLPSGLTSTQPSTRTRRASQASRTPWTACSRGTSGRCQRRSSSCPQKRGIRKVC